MNLVVLLILAWATHAAGDRRRETSQLRGTPDATLRRIERQAAPRKIYVRHIVDRLFTPRTTYSVKGADTGMHNIFERESQANETHHDIER
jgi:hypothetical protein